MRTTPRTASPRPGENRSRAATVPSLPYGRCSIVYGEGPAMHVTPAPCARLPWCWPARDTACVSLRLHFVCLCVQNTAQRVTRAFGPRRRRRQGALPGACNAELVHRAMRCRRDVGLKLFRLCFGIHICYREMSEFWCPYRRGPNALSSGRRCDQTRLLWCHVGGAQGTVRNATSTKYGATPLPSD